MKFTNEKGVSLIAFVLLFLVIIVGVGITIVMFQKGIDAKIQEEQPVEMVEEPVEVNDEEKDETSKLIEGDESFLAKDKDIFRNITFSFEPNNSNDIEVLSESTSWDVMDFGGTSYVKINNDEEVTVKEALEKDLITKIDIFQRIIVDSHSEGCEREGEDIKKEGLTYTYEKYKVFVTYKSNDTQIPCIVFSDVNNTYNDFVKKSLGLRNQDDLSGSEQLIARQGHLGYTGKESEDNIRFKFKDSKAQIVNKIITVSGFDIYTFMGDATVKIDDKEEKLYDSFINGDLTVKGLLKKLEFDSSNGAANVVYVSEYDEFTAYYYNEITIIVQNRYYEETPDIIFTVSKLNANEIVKAYLMIRSGQFSGSKYESGQGLDYKVKKVIAPDKLIVNLMAKDRVYFPDIFERDYYMVIPQSLKPSSLRINEGDVLSVVKGTDDNDLFVKYKINAIKEVETRNGIITVIDEESPIQYEEVSKPEEQDINVFEIKEVLSEDTYLVKPYYDNSYSGLVIIEADDTWNGDGPNEGDFFKAVNGAFDYNNATVYVKISDISRIEKAR